MDWQRIGIGMMCECRIGKLLQTNSGIGHGHTLDWQCIGYQLPINCKWICSGVELDCQLFGDAQVVGICQQIVMGWHLVDIGLSMDWHQFGTGLA